MLTPNEIQAMKERDDELHSIMHSALDIFPLDQAEIDRHNLLLDREELQAEIERLNIVCHLWLSTFQKYQSWKANGVSNDTLNQVLIDYQNCYYTMNTSIDAAIAQERKGEK